MTCQCSSDRQASFHINVHWLTFCQLGNVFSTHVYQALACLNALPANVRCEDHVFKFIKYVIQWAILGQRRRWRRPLTKDVDSGTSNFLLAQSIDERILVNN